MVNFTEQIVGNLSGPVREHVRCSPGRLCLGGQGLDSVRYKLMGQGPRQYD